jgi:hypothetical protein
MSTGRVADILMRRRVLLHIVLSATPDLPLRDVSACVALARTALRHLLTAKCAKTSIGQTIA